MSRKAMIGFGLLCFFAGISFGFLISPAKQGFGNNSGNQTYNHYYYFKKKPKNLEDYELQEQEEEIE